MEFEYRKISEERCKEIDSWEIHDPYGYGKVFKAERVNFVTSMDESLLFCQAFMPRHDDVSLGVKGFTYLFVEGNDYYLFEFECKDVKDNEIDGIKHRYMKINILKQNFIEESENKRELLDILKSMISKYEENFCRLAIARTWKYNFVFTYKGEEV